MPTLQFKLTSLKYLVSLGFVLPLDCPVMDLKGLLEKTQKNQKKALVFNRIVNNDVEIILNNPIAELIIEP